MGTGLLTGIRAVGFTAIMRGVKIRNIPPIRIRIHAIIVIDRGRFFKILISRYAFF